jgi:hypothetical protein
MHYTCLFEVEYFFFVNFFLRVRRETDRLDKLYVEEWVSTQTWNKGGKDFMVSWLIAD